MDKERKDAINEVIATKLFGLVEGKDYGVWPEHDWIRTCDDWLEAKDYEDLLKQNTLEERAKSSIDDFAYESGYCNGPRCARCGEEFCKHCEPDRWESVENGEPDGPCIIPIPNYFLESWFVPLVKKFLEEYGDEYTLEFSREQNKSEESIHGNSLVYINRVVPPVVNAPVATGEGATIQEALVEAIYMFLNAQ